MTPAKSLVLLLDKTFVYDAAGFLIPVTILDIFTRNGFTQALVTPVKGEGIHWVPLDKLEGVK
jgi:hypothetical protein